MTTYDAIAWIAGWAEGKPLERLISWREVQNARFWTLQDVSLQADLDAQLTWIEGEITHRREAGQS